MNKINFENYFMNKKQTTQYIIRNNSDHIFNNFKIYDYDW